MSFYGRPFEKLKVYAVTGTNGKTTPHTSSKIFYRNLKRPHGNGTIGTKIWQIIADNTFNNS